MKSILKLIIIAGMFCACNTHHITGAVFGEHQPKAGAVVGTDVSPNVTVTAKSGYFNLKIRTKQDSFFVYTWIPSDTGRTLVVERYYKDGGRIHLRMRD